MATRAARIGRRLPRSRRHRSAIEAPVARVRVWRVCGARVRIEATVARACVRAAFWLQVGLRTFEALYMITVFEGFMIISGSISGNLVMDEKAGQPFGSLLMYCVAIVIILIGLYVLLRGERAGADGRLLTRTMQPANDAVAMQDLRAVERAECDEVRHAHTPPTRNAYASPHAHPHASQHARLYSRCATVASRLSCNLPPPLLPSFDAGRGRANNPRT